MFVKLQHNPQLTVLLKYVVVCLTFDFNPLSQILIMGHLDLSENHMKQCRLCLKQKTTTKHPLKPLIELLNVFLLVGKPTRFISVMQMALNVTLSVYVSLKSSVQSAQFNYVRFNCPET